MTFYRRHLPHWHPEGASIFLTWRLYGSLPASVRTARNGCATKYSAGKRFQLLDSALDRCITGPLWLTNPRVAASTLVRRAFRACPNPGARFGLSTHFDDRARSLVPLMFYR